VMTTNGNGAATKGYFFEDLAVGMEANYAKKITNDDVLAFANLVGDTNPVHLDDSYAKTTRFKGRIAHGMLGASYISTAIASRLPGPGSIYLGQTLSFKVPVRPGDKVEARVTVAEMTVVAPIPPAAPTTATSGAKGACGLALAVALASMTREISSSASNGIVTRSTTPCRSSTRVRLKSAFSIRRKLHCATCDQNCRYFSQPTQSVAHLGFASDVKAAARPKPYCQCASSGSPLSVTRGISARAFGVVQT